MCFHHMTFIWHGQHFMDRVLWQFSSSIIFGQEKMGEFPAQFSQVGLYRIRGKREFRIAFIILTNIIGTVYFFPVFICFPKNVKINKWLSLFKIEISFPILIHDGRRSHRKIRNPWREKKKKAQLPIVDHMTPIRTLDMTKDDDKSWDVNMRNSGEKNSDLCQQPPAFFFFFYNRL